MPNQPATLSDFMHMEVQRTGPDAEIIFDHILHEGELKPVRLIGFVADACLSDYDIREQGYAYYQDLFAYLDTHAAPTLES
jgi:hypothetical protein